MADLTERIADKGRDADMQALQEAARVLGNHGFETIQIFATKELGEGLTRDVSHGTGNYLARYGQAKQWVEYQEETVRAHAFKATVEPGGDGE